MLSANGFNILILVNTSALPVDWPNILIHLNFAIETIFLLTSFFTFPIAGHVLKKSMKAPKGIVYLYIASISGIYVYLAARIVCFLYQNQVLSNWTFGSNECPWPLIIASSLRASVIASAAGSLATIMIERLVATIQVETYEKSECTLLAIWLIFCNLIICLVAGTTFTFDLVSYRTASLLGLMTSFVFALGCQFVLSLNKEAEEQMHRNWRKYGYSLTKRFQVAENIRNLKCLSRTMWWCMFNSLFFCTLFVIYIEVEMSWCWKNLLGSLIDLHASFYALSMTFVLFLSEKEAYRSYKRTLKQMWLKIISNRSLNEVRHSYEVYTTNRALIYSIATQEEYFRQLDEQWGKKPTPEPVKRSLLNLRLAV